MRTWAFSVLGGDNKLQTAPGQYDERVFQGLDYLLAAAALCNIRVVLVFTVGAWDPNPNLSLGPNPNAITLPYTPWVGMRAG